MRAEGPADGHEPEEGILFAELPIIDAHHHFFDCATGLLKQLTGRTRYLIDEHARELDCGHNFVGTVAVECHSMYRIEGPAEFRAVGETAVMAGQAALADTGLYGSCRIAEAIVGSADLRLGEAVRPVLEAHRSAAPGRFKGIRQNGAWDPNPDLLGPLGVNGAHMYSTDTFRRGFGVLASLGLVFDAFILSPQIPDVTALARAFPNVPIVLNHLGNPLGLGSYAERRDEVFEQWRTDMAALAQEPNARIKLGGLGTMLTALPSCSGPDLPSEEALVADWTPFIDTTITLFGAERCMFEGNYPVERGAGSYRTIWNAFKRITRGASDAERRALFAGTAARTYGMSASPYPLPSAAD